MPITLNGTTGIVTPDLDSAEGIKINGTEVYTYVPLFPVSGATTNAPTCTWPAKAYPVSGSSPAGSGTQWVLSNVPAASIGNNAYVGPDLTFDLDSINFPVPITAKFVNLRINSTANTYRNGTSSIYVKIGSTYYSILWAEGIDISPSYDASIHGSVILPITGAGTSNRTVILQYYNSPTGGTPGGAADYNMDVIVLGYYL